jgi:hypothetical protein
MLADTCLYLLILAAVVVLVILFALPIIDINVPPVAIVVVIPITDPAPSSPPLTSPSLIPSSNTTARTSAFFSRSGAIRRSLFLLLSSTSHIYPLAWGTAFFITCPPLFSTHYSHRHEG